MLGFTTSPQSTTETTRCTWGAPFSIEISTTSAAYVLKQPKHAIPRYRPAANGLLQLAFSAANFSTFLIRAVLHDVSKYLISVSFESNCNRYSSGSFPAAAANSSMKLSVAKPICSAYTERIHPKGTGVSVTTDSSDTLGIG